MIDRRGEAQQAAAACAHCGSRLSSNSSVGGMDGRRARACVPPAKGSSLRHSEHSHTHGTPSTHAGVGDAYVPADDVRHRQLAQPAAVSTRQYSPNAEPRRESLDGVGHERAASPRERRQRRCGVARTDAAWMDSCGFSGGRAWACERTGPDVCLERCVCVCVFAFTKGFGVAGSGLGSTGCAQSTRGALSVVPLSASA
jgi:hypothetical protein